ncbi:MAG: hypothetical protein LBN99_07170 [Oscillospiraceae bacterium]|nr:hypothetical protein [Oscillospiraceae bacterium]
MRNTKDWLNRMLAGAFLCLALSDLLWNLYQTILHEYPMDFTASDISWIGYYLFLLSINFSLTAKWTAEDKRVTRHFLPLSLIAPVLATLFHLSFYLLHGDLIINAIYCAAFAPLAYTAFHLFLASGGRTSIQPRLHRYHGMVLLFLASEEIMYLLSALDFYDVSILFDILLTLSALLIVNAAKGGAGE